jgi:hypothetical protein
VAPAGRRETRGDQPFHVVIALVGHARLGLDPGRYALAVNIAGEVGKALSEGRSGFDVQ